MLDAQRNVFFAHIPKTGGTAIEFAHGFEIGQAPLRHTSFSQMMIHQRETGGKLPKHVFVVKRDIFSRLQSTYKHFFRTGFCLRDRTPETYTFTDYIRAIWKYHNNDGCVLLYKHIRPADQLSLPLAQVDHVVPFSWWTEGAPDIKILRFEHLAEDYERLITPLTGVSSVELNRRVNDTPSEFASIPCEYTPETRRMVEDVFAEEIALHLDPV